MRSGNETAVIQRIFHRNGSARPERQEDTSASLAVMMRVLPPVRALLSVRHAPSRAYLRERLDAHDLDIDVADHEVDALDRCAAQFYPIVITDRPDLIQRVRALTQDRYTVILMLTEHDAEAERLEGLRAGADDCIARRMPELELQARITSARRITSLEALLRTTVSESRKLSTTDELTGLTNRRFFGQQLPREVERAVRYGRALSLIMCDIDHFKRVNDTYGHGAGDEVLKQFGARLRECLRRGVDWAARLGGEEFAIVLPETGYQSALEVARKLRTLISDTPFTTQDRSIAVTASFGLCGVDQVSAGDRKVSQRLLEVADAALYRSKHAGRNRVTAVAMPPASSRSPTQVTSG